MLLDLSARSLDDVSVLHARRASSLTCQAAKTAIDMRDERIVDRQASVIYLQDLINAAAWRICLKPEHAMRRTVIQAQPTVNAG
jgi:hypothetical protein